MSPLRSLALLAGLAILVGGVAGCSGGGLGNNATVSGTITHNGVPIDGAKITFHSTAEAGGSALPSYAAQTDSTGKYVLTGVGKQLGIPPGMYKVTIVKLDLKAMAGNLPKDFDRGQMEASGMARNVLPAAYESLASTKLSVTLEPGKNVDKNFDLKGEGSATGPSPAGKTP